MNDEMSGYKVVCRDGDVLKSIVMQDSVLRTIYEPGKPAQSDVGPLMFFDSLSDAQLFIHTLTSYTRSRAEIWSCVATNPRKAKFMACGLGLVEPHTSSELKRLKEWWEIADTKDASPGRRHWGHTQDRLNKLFYTASPPPGTFLADTITLKKRIDK